MQSRRLLGFIFIALAACATGAVEDEPVTDIADLTPSPTADLDHDGFTAKVDCDDHDPAVHPGATETCNGKDDDCNGKIDEGFDADGDGWVSCGVGTKVADCDDHDPLVNPGAKEICSNGKDDNCDGKIDEARDEDNDGFGSCPKSGQKADCDDADPNVKPGATERCNGIDDDCDGKIDEIPATLEGSLVTPINPHWALAGSAAFSNGWVQLTPEQTNKAGALWWNATYVFDTFEVTASFWMPNKTDCADGIAFAAVPGSDVTRVGAPGYGYGVAGLGGIAVVIDTFTNTGEPEAPFLVVLDAQSGAHLTRQKIAEVRNGQEHRLRVKLDAGKVSVWLDGAATITDFALPTYAPFAGHWGFTAGTGAGTCAPAVRNVTMSFPNGQGCVP